MMGIPMNGMQELRQVVDGMGRLEAALTAMAPVMATKEDIEKLKTAMETRFETISRRLDVMEAAMQNLQRHTGWEFVPEDANQENADEMWERDWTSSSGGRQCCKRRSWVTL